MIERRLVNGYAERVQLPNGYRIVWAGEFEDLEQAKKHLTIIVPLSLILIVVLLYGLFNSARDSLLALLGIPFAVGGGIIALFVTGIPFSVSAAIGFISLFGVSVMDRILIITYFNQLRTSGLAPLQAFNRFWNYVCGLNGSSSSNRWPAGYIFWACPVPHGVHALHSMIIVRSDTAATWAPSATPSPNGGNGRTQCGSE